MFVLPNENLHRFVVVLNRKVEPGRLMNALGHMAAGLAGGHPDREQLCLLQYRNIGTVAKWPFWPFSGPATEGSERQRGQRLSHPLAC